MTGKLADTVMSVRNGEQIARKYQPVVFNPSTPAQVAQRAKLKLLSQLSAVLGREIAIPKMGTISSRNLFTKLNMPKATFSDGSAHINLPDLDITSSAVGLPNVTASLNVQGGIDVALDESMPTLSRVVYVALSVLDDRSVRVSTSTVIDVPGGTSRFPGTLEGSFTTQNVVLAYGMRDNTDAARAVFGNLEVPTSANVAQILTTRSLTSTDITVTETRGVQVASTGNRDEVEFSKKKAK